VVFTRWSSTGQRKVGQDFLSGATCSGEMILVWLLGNQVHQSSPASTSNRLTRLRTRLQKKKNPPKNIKLAKFVPDKEMKVFIKEDEQNVNLWKACLDFKGDKKSKYDHIGETFGRVICRELLEKPVTLPCLHNICISCPKRTFKGEVYTCPFATMNLRKSTRTLSTKCESAIKKTFHYLKTYDIFVNNFKHFFELLNSYKWYLRLTKFGTGSC
jgi:hypothetical protein